MNDTTPLLSTYCHWQTDRANLAEVERSTYCIGPPRHVSTVIAKQSHRQAIHAESNATGMGRLFRSSADPPNLSEVIPMVVETHTRGRCGFFMVGNEQLEFQGLLQLTDGHHLADSTEKRVARDFNFAR